jgi:hypothetical protein
MATLTQQQSQQLYGSDRYTGWGETEASANAKALGITGGNSSGDDFASKFGMSLNEYLNSVNGSADKLLEIAKGDYNLVAKWLEKDYTDATGVDDQARKDLIKKVSNDVEAKTGTLAFDYNTGTYRTQQDMGITETNTNADRSLALKRLAEDDATLRTQYKTQAVADRNTTGESLNSRGMLNGKYDANTGQSTISGVGSTNVNNLEQNIQDKFDALTRATGRSGTDINTSADRTLAQNTLTGNRTLEDLTTGVRRGLNNAGDAYQSGLDQAQQAKKAQELKIEQDRAKQKALANSYAYNGTMPS